MKIDKIYTRTGDDGMTSMGDGSRLPKFSLRVTAIGDVDEANAAIGVAALHLRNPAAVKLLKQIQNDLFDLGADLCLPERTGSGSASLRITEEQVVRLEREIDRFNAALAPLDSFVLPGGSAASAHLHFTRTITRRAEREIVRLASEEPVNSAVLRYVNRLSDLLFVLARYFNGKGKKDVRWRPGLHR